VIDGKAAGLCHSDVSFVDGTITSLLGSIPIVLGHEIAGVVSAVGSNVTAFEVGQRVGVPATTEGPGTATNGGFAEKVLVEDRLVVHVPDGASFEQAAPATDAARTAYRAVETFGKVTEGTKVGIIGFGTLGSLGTLGSQIAKAVGAKICVAEVNKQAWAPSANSA
jgi:propanol-preferring alcohol dehydrogenase